MGVPPRDIFQVPVSPLHKPPATLYWPLIEFAVEFMTPVKFTSCEPGNATPIVTEVPEMVPETDPELLHGEPVTDAEPVIELPVWAS